jgi:type IV secretory pathway VirB2 component (pilin)
MFVMVLEIIYLRGEGKSWKAGIGLVTGIVLCFKNPSFMQLAIYF